MLQMLQPEALNAVINIIEIIQDPKWNMENRDASDNEFLPSHARV